MSVSSRRFNLPSFRNESIQGNDESSSTHEGPSGYPEGMLESEREEKAGWEGGGQGGRWKEARERSPQTLVELDLIDLTVDFHRMPYALEPSCLPALEICAEIVVKPTLTTLVAFSSLSPQC